jgi:broad specificity phosphatase PhoE/CTP:molybdopterin cytidylyltransferase MocA
MAKDKTASESGASENNAIESKAAGLILAAGLSSRMGSFKPLLPIGDVTANERVIDTLKKAGVKNIIGVTGFQKERLSPILAAHGVKEAFNPDFERGMFTSIKAGIGKALDAQTAPEGAAANGQPEKPDGFFLMLVDCPLTPPEVLGQIWEQHLAHPDSFILPCYRGKNGHPLFIPAQYAEEILAYEGVGGLKAIRNRHEDKLIRLETDTEAVVLDMDTPEGYEEVLEFYAMREDPDYEAQLRGRRLFLIRHGEIRQHREKIFLGQTDVPLSDRGREQAAQAAETLRQYGAAVCRIYTSDLSRAAETAEIIRDRLDQPRPDQPRPGRETPIKSDEGISVIREPRLREMCLGEWDGCYISGIMERYPEEYRKRGENLLSFKFGNDSENFYDLQYRVMKGFRSILKREMEAADGAKDLIIVAHHGVISVIISSLRYTVLGEELKKPAPNGGVIILDYTEKEILS